MIANVLAGQTDEAIRILKTGRDVVATDLDAPPLSFFRHRVELAIDTVEGRLTKAFINEMTPPITDPAKAWKHNVDTNVRGGLALSLCAERPNPESSSALVFDGRWSALVRDSSPTANQVSNWNDPTLVELARVGVFQAEESFLLKDCLSRIKGELQPLLETIPTLSESAETIRSLLHFHHLVVAPLGNADLVLLRGYLL